MGMPVHRYERRLELFEKRIRDSAISEQSKAELFRYRNELISESYSSPRVLKLLGVMFVFAKEIGKPLSEATEDDVRRVITVVEGSDRAAWTKFSTTGS